MGLKKVLFSCVFLAALSTFSEEIVLGIEKRPIRKFAIIFTPIVIPDIISFKAAFEFKIHPRFNILWPFEAKYMNYHWFSPQKLYAKSQSIQPGWNFDFSQTKVSSGLGIKWFIFSDSMSNGFFLKTALLAGIERFNAFSKEGIVHDAIFTHNFSIGYSWFSMSGIMCGLEIGEEYTWHTHPIEDVPILIKGFNPFLQMNFGFAF